MGWIHAHASMGLVGIPPVRGVKSYAEAITIQQSAITWMFVIVNGLMSGIPLPKDAKLLVTANT